MTPWHEQALKLPIHEVVARVRQYLHEHPDDRSLTRWDPQYASAQAAPGRSNKQAKMAGWILLGGLAGLLDDADPPHDRMVEALVSVALGETFSYSLQSYITAHRTIPGQCPGCCQHISH